MGRRAHVPTLAALESRCQRQAAHTRVGFLSFGRGATGASVAELATNRRSLSLSAFQIVDSHVGRIDGGAIARCSHRLHWRRCQWKSIHASAALRGLVESGALVREADGWRVEPEAMNQFQASSRSAGFLAKRLDLLSDDALRLLTAGAVLGKEFDWDATATVTGHPRKPPRKPWKRPLAESPLGPRGWAAVFLCP